jgi:hypothetical protein
VRAKGTGGLSGCDTKHSCRAGCPLIPPAGTFSPHGVQKDRMDASARPMPGGLRPSVQRRLLANPWSLAAHWDGDLWRKSARLGNRLVSLFVKEAWINSTTNRRVGCIVQ